MWKIDSTVKTLFMVAYSFKFSERYICNQSDILDACQYIYSEKHVLYKSRHNAQKYSLSGYPAAQNMRDNLLIDLSKKVWDYFNNAHPNMRNTQGDFDKFHNALCIWFRDGLTDVRRAAGLSDATYGNAQKMVNILFKYLACFEDYSKFSDLFSYCHIPIDNYILRNVFSKIGVPDIKLVFRDITYKSKGWYNFDEKTYKELVDDYRKQLSLLKPSDLPYLAIDFYWWRGMTVSLPKTGSIATPIAGFYC